MQGLEFVDVPGLVIFATGASVLGAMLIAGIGWRKLERQTLERLHTSVKTNIVLSEIDAALRFHADGRDKAAVEQLHAVHEERCADVVACPIDIDFESDDCTDASGTRELLEPEYDDEITVPVLYTSADMARCREGATVRPIRRSAS